VMEKGADGRMRISRVTLRPRIVFAEVPDPAALDALHHKAHEACFIANSVTSEVVVEPR
jgi:organic hydroperoxide reductase OsmC/OhrA